MRAKKPKDYKQFAAAWGKKPYSSRGDKSQTMKKAGCAPTAAADIIAELCDPTIIPYDIAQLFVAKGFRKDGNGTSAGCFKWIANRYRGKGIRQFKRLYKLAGIVKALDQGALIVAHMGPGYWTGGGHYIVLWRYADGYLFACDPGSSTRKKQEAKALMKQAKGFYAFWP